MKLHQIASNQTQLTLASGTQILFSYQTPVAAYIHGHGYVRTEQYYSKTTSKHITQWLHGAKAILVPQEKIDALLR
jgi:hypothetical protein